MDGRRQAQPARRGSGADRLRRAGLTLAGLAAAALLATPAAADPRLFARYKARVAHVEVVGHLADGGTDIGGGSGLLLGDSFVVTNAHLLPEDGNYDSVELHVRLGSRNGGVPIAVRAVHRDASRDLALLELAAPAADAGGRRCPMPATRDAGSVPTGTRIYVLGYPLNQDLSIVDGLISNQAGAAGRWQTNALLNKGNSGGPVFDGDGALVGLVVSGLSSFTLPDGQRLNVTGINFIIPTGTLVDSPLYAQLAQLPEDRRCWAEHRRAAEDWDYAVAAGETMSEAVGAAEHEADPDSGPRAEAAVEDAPEWSAQHPRPNHPETWPRVRPSPPAWMSEALPEAFNRGVSVALQGAAAPGPAMAAERVMAADTGYRIAGCTVKGESSGRAGAANCEVAPDGRSAKLKTTLDGGAAGQRGWWLGTVYLDQVRTP